MVKCSRKKGRLKIISSEKPTAKVERIEKPWGYELIWAKTQNYVGKVLFVTAGSSLSLQYHRIKEETMFLESGDCVIESGADEKSLTPHKLKSGDVFHIPPGRLHQLTATTDCRIFEVSTPHLNDIVRLKDNYGRT